MEYFRPETNMTETIALRYTTGKPCTSKLTNEDQVMFSLVDGRVWYAPPFVASKVEGLGLQAFEDFIVCRREVKTGNRKSIEWQLARPETAEAPSPSKNGAPAEVAAPIAPEPPYVIASNGNGNGHVPAPAPPPAPRAIPTIEDAAAKLLERTGKMALDAVLEVERYAREVRQLEGFTFGPANVQSIWCTLFINATRNGGR